MRCVGPVHVPFYIGVLGFWRDDAAEGEFVHCLTGGHCDGEIGRTSRMRKSEF